MGLKSSAAFIAANNFQNSILTDRALIEAMFQTEGVLSPTDFAPTPGTGLAMKMAAGFAAIEGREAPDQGFYFAWSEAEESIAWTVPDSQPRVDSLLLRVADAQYGTVSGSQGAYWQIINGVPAASPTARSDSDINTNFDVPGAWLRMLDYRVNPGDTTIDPARITDHRKITQGITQAGTTVMRDKMDTSKLKAGFTFFNTTTGLTETWSGTAWLSNGWVNCASEVELQNASTGVAGPTQSKIFCRYAKHGKTVHYQGDIAVGATGITDVSVLLPPSAGTPSVRSMNCGTLFVFGTGAPADQIGIGFMGGAKDRIICVASTAGYRPAAANTSVRWAVTYEVQ